MIISNNGYLPNEILNASYNYSQHEIDVMLAVINNYKGGTEIVLNFETLLVNFGTSNANNKELKNTIRGIIEKPLEYYNKELQTYLICSIITSAEIDTIRRKVKFTINETLGKIINQAQREYSRFNFETMLKLKSRYAKRLYLYCNSWRKTGVWEADIEKLKKRLGVSDKYEKFNDFNKRVLAPAFEEINEKSEYRITVDYLKEGKQYTSLLCSIVLKQEFRKPGSKYAGELKACGLSDWQIKNVCAILQDAEIEKQLNTVKMNRNNIKNVGAWLAATFAAIGVPMEKSIF
jgi:plasmid replication initiation protein